MRVAAVADIHGNLPALEAVLAEVEREHADQIVVLGDTISGPWPAECFDLVADAVIVRGNADREVLERSDRFGPLAPWSADRLGAERLATAAAWPLVHELEISGLGTVLACHSTPVSDEAIHTRVTPEADLHALLGDVESDVLLCGHTHVQFDRRLASGLRVVNPGSVGLPYEGSPGAYWALLGPGVELRRTPYEVETTAARVRELGAPVDERLLDHLVDPPTSEETAAYFESLRGA